MPYLLLSKGLMSLFPFRLSKKRSGVRECTPKRVHLHAEACFRGKNMYKKIGNCMIFYFFLPEKFPILLLYIVSF